ncbi:transporter substrate-binding domain-containing protein [Desulfococcaceae bacterium HSG8]|nr:transporter substrate-binding domain-containing protein [Desulfococcaceae bacterium HSG8]
MKRITEQDNRPSRIVVVDDDPSGMGRKVIMKVKSFVLFILLGISVNANAESVNLVLAYENKEQPPYYYGNTTRIPSSPGITVDIVKQLENRIPGLKINFVRYPWKRCLLHLQKGEVDGLFKATYKLERTKTGRYPMRDGKIDPERKIAVMSNSLYKLKQSAIGWDGKNFSNVNGYICAPRGYIITSILKEINIQVIESDSSMSCLAKVMLKRVAAAALQTVTGDALFKTYPERFRHLEKVSPPLSTKPQYLMLSHQFVIKNPEMAERIWNAIAAIRQEDLEEIALQYVE